MQPPKLCWLIIFTQIYNEKQPAGPNSLFFDQKAGSRTRWTWVLRCQNGHCLCLWAPTTSFPTVNCSFLSQPWRWIFSTFDPRVQLSTFWLKWFFIKVVVLFFHLVNNLMRTLWSSNKVPREPLAWCKRGLLFTLESSPLCYNDTCWRFFILFWLNFSKPS